MPKGSAKIMLSYDYCHFEICLSSDEDKSLEQVDEMRKDAQRLADKAVKQYRTAKELEMVKANTECGMEQLRREAKAIKENFPQSEWTPEQMAKVKLLEDKQFILSRQYDYEDDFDPEDWGNL